MGYDDNQFDILKGKKVLKIIFNERNLQFDLENGRVVFEAVGDCCSSSYIESLDNPDIFTNATFISIESVSGEQEAVDDYDVHKWTFYKFKTNKGMCTLSFRNESNGYYDGHLELAESTQTGE